MGTSIKLCVAIAVALMPGACAGEPTAVETRPGTEVGIVVSSIDRVATVFVVDSPQSIVQIGLGPDGTPVTVGARKTYAVVPLGTLPAAAIVDLRQRRVAATVALPLNSGATGVAFISDSIALVANPGRNSVIPINVVRGTAGAEVTVGTYPQAITAVGDTAYVLNGELGPNFTPERTGTVTVLTGSPPRVLATIELSGNNPLAAVGGVSGELYVLNAGSFGAANGSLSIVDRGTMREIRHDVGFGEFPGTLARGADGSVYVGAFAFGIAVWQPATRTFTRSPAHPVRPGGIGSNSGLGVDAAGRLYALKPECRTPGRALRLGPAFEVEAEIATGICPFGIAFTQVPGSE